MFNKKIYNINNFYIGELYLSYEFKNLLQSENSIQKSKTSSLCINGAINFEQGLLRKYIDWEKRKSYEGILTIFYKENDNYISLYSGKLYNSNSEDFYENLVSLPNALPKSGFDIPSRISIKEALFLFDTLFKNSKAKNIEEFYSTDYQIPDWIKKGIIAVQKAPSARNIQPIAFNYSNGILSAYINHENPQKTDFIDLGIAKSHFEIATGQLFEIGNNGKLKNID